MLFLLDELKEFSSIIWGFFFFQKHSQFLIETIRNIYTKLGAQDDICTSLYRHWSEMKITSSMTCQ